MLDFLRGGGQGIAAPSGVWLSTTNFGPSVSYVDGDGMLKTHVFGFDGDLHGQQLAVTLITRIRPHREFDDAEEAIRLDVLAGSIMHALPDAFSTVAWSGDKESCLLDQLVELKGVRRLRMRLFQTETWSAEHRHFVLSTSHHMVESIDAWPRHMPCLVGTRRENTEDLRDFVGDWLGAHTPVIAPLYELSHADVCALIRHLGTKVHAHFTYKFHSVSPS